MHQHLFYLNKNLDVSHNILGLSTGLVLTVRAKNYNVGFHDKILMIPNFHIIFAVFFTHINRYGCNNLFKSFI